MRAVLIVIIVLAAVLINKQTKYPKQTLSKWILYGLAIASLIGYLIF